jgi:hypothetical protein
MPNWIAPLRGLVEIIKTDISFAYIRAPDERYALDIMWTQ